MKNKIILIVICLIFLFSGGIIFAQENMLKGGIANVPEVFFGLWRVSSFRLETDSPGIFKEKSFDLWNISKVGNVITLSNPFSGASAQVKVNNAGEDNIVFTRKGGYDGKILIDTVSITINEDDFKGVDLLELQTKSDVDGSIIKTERAKYSVKGERLYK